MSFSHFNFDNNYYNNIKGPKIINKFQKTIKKIDIVKENIELRLKTENSFDSKKSNEKEKQIKEKQMCQSSAQTQTPTQTQNQYQYQTMSK